MAKAGTADDDLFPGLTKEAPKKKRGAQEDGTYVTSSGEVLPKKDREKRDPYPEPEEKQVVGHTEIVENPDGTLSFAAVRLNEEQFAAAGYPERKRLKLWYEVTEVYSGRPRQYYSFDELEQIRRAEMKR